MKEELFSVRNITVIAVFGIITSILIVFSGRHGYADRKEGYAGHKREFENMGVIRDTLLATFPGCYKIRFTLTDRGFMSQNCVEERENRDQPKRFLSEEYEDTIRLFMSDQDFKYISMDSQYVMFYFGGYDPEKMVLARHPVKDLKQYAIDSLVYKVPGYVRIP